MSLYNLENRTILNYYILHKEKLLNFSDKDYIFKYFSAGKKVNKKEQTFSYIMEELLKTQNCELINYMNDMMAQVVIIKDKCGKPLVISKCNVPTPATCNITQIIEKKMIWKNVQW